MSGHKEGGFRLAGLNAWRALERLVDNVFGSAQNPLRHIGTLAFLALWLLVVSGIILYVLFDTSVYGAWHSVESLAHLPLGLGRLLRGVHRYAADLLIVAVVLHLLREWLYGHAQGVRRFHWLTGVPLLVFCFISAIGGFWLAWDQLSQYSAVSTAEWLDGLPLLASPLARNFLSDSAVSDRMFSLFIFVHVGLPLLLLFGLWFHIQRLAHVAMLPPRRLTLGIITVLAALAIIQPVLSHAPAALNQMPANLRLDWLVLWLHPLTDLTSRGFTLTLVSGFVLLLFALPFLPQAPRASVAVVNAENCSGCTYCFDDCPYAAITMVPHPDHRSGHLLAQVDADLCIGCGICAGSCPSSTPFRSAEPLITGIDMPDLSIDYLRQRLRASLAKSRVPNLLVVFSCRHAASCTDLQSDDVSVIDLHCAGQLPPSFLEYAVRHGAAGVLLVSCHENGCEFRLGQQWTMQRLERKRQPQLRNDAPIEQFQLVFAAPGEENLPGKALHGLREKLQATSSHARISANEIIN